MPRVDDRTRPVPGESAILNSYHRHVFDLITTNDTPKTMHQFGGGVTSLEAFAVCAPVVTAPALQTVPGLAAGMYAQMGLWEGKDDAEGKAGDAGRAVAPVASTVEGYARHALWLLRNATAHTQLRASICEVRYRLYENATAVEEWAAFLKRTAGAAGVSSGL